MRTFCLLLVMTFLSVTTCLAQKKMKDSIKIFKDNVPIDVKLVTDMKRLIYSKKKPAYQDARWISKLPDSSLIDEKIQIIARGVFRRENCYIPSLRLNFKNTATESEKIAVLNQLKMVSPCETGDIYDQLLVKEYLIYKMYNLLTKMSFKVRLLNLTFEDSKGTKKPITQHSFLIEDIDRLAKRNDCKEFVKQVMQENTDRDQMTLIALFQYMIGNTDWEVANFHNMKLIAPKDDPTHKPYAVPYDFDVSGLVNAPYAAPNPSAGTTYVTERWYMGYERTIEEIMPVVKKFLEQKDNILKLVSDCEYLTKVSKKDMIEYLNEFFNGISDEGFVRRTFVNNARF